jgi:6-pyruvoyltetrahydropterin/6-carboxytetrahydropterin synthase
MYRVMRELRFCYGHRLLGHAGKCRHLHGHNARAVIVLEVERLDRLGMVVDFGDVKQLVGGWIDATLDHRLILHRDDPLLGYLREQGEPVYALDENPTAENLARLIWDFAAARGLPVVEVHLWETDDSCASFRGACEGASGR